MGNTVHYANFMKNAAVVKIYNYELLQFFHNGAISLYANIIGYLPSFFLLLMFKRIKNTYQSSIAVFLIIYMNSVEVYCDLSPFLTNFIIFNLC